MSDGVASEMDALAAGTSALVGRYRYDGHAWSWSDEMYLMHGFQPGKVRPSSDLLVAHHDADDVGDAREAFKRALTSGETFTSYHHLVDAHRRRRTVLVVGGGRIDDRGAVVELHGYMVDLTDVTATDRLAEVEAAVAGVTEHRAAIEQAKGVLMLAFAITSDEAFAVLRAHSQHHNIKLHTLAERLVRAVGDDTSIAEGDTRGQVMRALDELTGGAGALDP